MIHIHLPGWGSSKRTRTRAGGRNLCVCVCVCMCVCISMCIYMYVCMYVCMCVCMYVYMYMYMYVCIHTHTTYHPTRTTRCRRGSWGQNPLWGLPQLFPLLVRRWLLLVSRWTKSCSIAPALCRCLSVCVSVCVLVCVLVCVCMCVCVEGVRDSNKNNITIIIYQIPYLQRGGMWRCCPGWAHRLGTSEGKRFHW
jgi:hypothetical protein